MASHAEKSAVFSEKVATICRASVCAESVCCNASETPQLDNRSEAIHSCQCQCEQPPSPNKRVRPPANGRGLKLRHRRQLTDEFHQSGCAYCLHTHPKRCGSQCCCRPPTDYWSITKGKSERRQQHFPPGTWQIQAVYLHAQITEQ